MRRLRNFASLGGPEIVRGPVDAARIGRAGATCGYLQSFWGGWRIRYCFLNHCGLILEVMNSNQPGPPTQGAGDCEEPCLS